MSAVPSHSLTLTTMLALMMVMVVALMVVFMIGVWQVRLSFIERARGTCARLLDISQATLIHPL